VASRETTRSFELAAGESAPTAARLAVDGIAEELGALYDDVRLLVSELVTNSVRHAGLGAGAFLSMTIWTSPAGVRVEVSDDGRGFDHAPRRAAEDPGGWGLYLVRRLADRWGVAPAGGACVWFELEHAQAESARASA
jgi:anti-sigma regulatory factor (Ser/Thr protein kinase)